MWIFVINLDRDRDRLARMVAETKRVGISFDRFVAVDGNRMEGVLRDKFFSASGPHEAAFTAGEIGCYASHLRIHQLLEEKNSECALILEDDTALADDLVTTIESAMACAPGWDIIRLSNAPKAPVLPVAPLEGGRELVRYWTVPNGTAAYLINRTGAIKFVEAYKKRTLPIDEDLRRPWRSGLNTYGVMPPPVADGQAPSCVTAMGRPRGVPARVRFKDASPYRDLLAVWAYRFEVFGPRQFCRALWRAPVADGVRKVLGKAAAERLYRL